MSATQKPRGSAATSETPDAADPHTGQPEGDKYATVWPDDAFVSGVEGITVTAQGTQIPAAHVDAVKQAAKDNNVTIKKVG